MITMMIGSGSDYGSTTMNGSEPATLDHSKDLYRAKERFSRTAQGYSDPLSFQIFKLNPDQFHRNRCKRDSEEERDREIER